MNQRTFCARVRSRRKKPSTIKMARPIKIAISCLGSSSGTVEPVTASDSVHRKNAIVSISKPMRRNRRMTMKYAQQITVKTKKVSGMVVVALSPCAIMSCRPVRIWNSVSSTREPHIPAGLPSMRRSTICVRFSSAVMGSMIAGIPAKVTVSPSSTSAYSSTGRSFTLMPPLEPRSYIVQLPSSSRMSAAC